MTYIIDQYNKDTHKSIYLLNEYKEAMIHASIHAIMLIVSLGTWKSFVNKFDAYVMYRSVYFLFSHFRDKK